MNDRERMNCEMDYCDDFINIKNKNQKFLINWFNENYNENYINQKIEFNNIDLKLLYKEYRTSLGYVDLICIDSDKNEIPVEIKKHEAGDGALGQILGYMKALNSNKGIIIARSFSDRLLALAKDYNVELFYYIIYYDKPYRILKIECEKYFNGYDIYVGKTNKFCEFDDIKNDTENDIENDIEFNSANEKEEKMENGIKAIPAVGITTIYALAECIGMSPSELEQALIKNKIPILKLVNNTKKKLVRLEDLHGNVTEEN